jgi:hypothetical protein
METQADTTSQPANLNSSKIDQATAQQQQSTNVGSQDMYNEFIGAIKIRDGLFIGDQLAAQDYEFVVTNKVTHIINTAGLHIRNYWESIGVKYLTFDWIDQDCQVILDSNNINANKIFSFIEEAYEQGESCLVHSVRGQSRASTVLAGYFMKKYKWSLFKTIEFLNNRRPDLEIRASFIRQLSYYEKRLLHETGVQSDAWTELASKPHLENDELILTHTFLNAQMGPIADFTKTDSTLDLKPDSKLKWTDNERESKKDLLITNESKDDLPNKDYCKVTTHYDSLPNRSIIKVPFESFAFQNPSDSEDNETSEQKSKNDTQKVDTELSNNKTIVEQNTKHSKSIEAERDPEPIISNKNTDTSERFSKPFEYSTTDLVDLRSKDEPKKPKFFDEKPRHKISSSVDKGKVEKDGKTLNFKTKKSSDNTVKGSTKTSLSTTAHNPVETNSRFKPSIKKESIKVKNYRGPSAHKKPKPKEPKKRRRPRSNDDRKNKEKLAYNFENTNSGKRAVSRGVSEKSTKKTSTAEQFKRRNIVNKFMNNSHMLAEQNAKIDSRNIYAHNVNQKKKNWNSASLNLKKYVKKKDLSMTYNPMKKSAQKKSQEIKMTPYKTNGLAMSAEQQFKSFMKNKKQFAVNPYFPSNSEFSKSFGSSIYNPNTR